MNPGGWLRLLGRFWRDEEGQGIVEYGLILVLISIIAIAAMGEVGSSHTTILEDVTNTLDTIST